MEILLAVIDGQSEAEVVVSVGRGATVGALARELGGVPGSTLEVRRTGTELDPALPVADVDLRLSSRS